MNLTQRHLTLFEAIARLESLSKAASEQAISQSAASQSLKEMEKQLGYELFRKVGRSLRITDAGSKALPKVRQMLASMESLKFPEASFIGGRLSVSASETLGSYLLPALLADFVAQYPRVEPELTILNTEGVVQQIEQGGARLGFVEGPTHSSLVHVTHWKRDSLVVFCDPQNHWVRDGHLPDSELASLPWIVRESGSGTRAVFDHAFVLRNETPRIRLSLSRQDAIKQSVRMKLGIGCLSEMAVSDELLAGHLVALETSLELSRPLSLIRLKDEALSPLSQKFYEFSLAWRQDNLTTELSN